MRPAAADKGRLAMTIWSEVLPKVDQRWRRRLGSKLARLSPALAELASTAAVAMPEGLSSGWGLVRIPVEGQVALERREVGSWSTPEPT